MKRRRTYYQPSRPTQNLDSFLDIMTNTVGVLMFVSLFITLVATESGTTIRTPLVTHTQKDSHLFEISQNKVTYLNTNRVQEQIKQFIQTLPTCEKPTEPYYLYELDSYLSQIYQYKDCLDQQKKQLNNFRPQTDFYEVILINLESFAWEYKRKDGVTGESSEQLSQTDSKFKQSLRQLDPQKDYLAFIVRPDSFPAFRQARKIAWQEGFNVGWEPSNPDIPIILGSEGRTIGVQ